MTVDIKLSGLNEVESQLKKLGAVGAVTELNKALMAASKPTWDRARRNASFSTNFRNAIKRVKQRSLNKKRQKLNFTKGFRRAASGSNRVTGVSIIVAFKKAPHFHLIELGTKDRRKKTNGQRTGRVEARSMLGKAFDGNAPSEAVKIFEKRIKARVNKLIKNGSIA